ncbi:MAG: hypothetical protein JKX85_00030 [Phycisphaeraceae bacterium]|nr:hypothetical protein [Phycisphaeraceae bacterium]
MDEHHAVCVYRQLDGAGACVNMCIAGLFLTDEQVSGANNIESIRNIDHSGRITEDLLQLMSLLQNIHDMGGNRPEDFHRNRNVRLMNLATDQQLDRRILKNMWKIINPEE